MVQEKRRRFYTILIVLALVISVFSHVFLFGPTIIFIGSAADDSDSYYNDTTLNVTVLQLEPRINWYDLWNSTSDSMLNDRLDVNQEYYFKVNISSDQGWVDIDFINISCWYDWGSEAQTYNQTKGGNTNLQLQYENSTATGDIATWRLLWPDDEASINVGGCSDVNTSDPDGSPGNTEAHNLTFAFTPSYQMRYTPAMSDTNPGHNDTWSWNINITADDDGGLHSYNNPIVGETIDEFGFYSYTEIITAGWPTITGNPGDTPAYNDSYINLQYRSNGNYSLSVNVDNLTHTVTGSHWIDNTSIYTAGGELSPLTAFNGNHQQYYYGNYSAGTYSGALGNGTSNTTTDAEWAVDIAMGQYPGDYNATIYYQLMTQTF
jgi:hypothetical protein